MKKTIGLLIALLLLSVSVQAGTDPNRWDGFRGLKWGTNIKNINDPNMIIVEDNNDSRFYRRLNDKLSIGDAKLESISYGFYKDRFCWVMIKAKEESNFTDLKAAVFAYYGEGKQSNEFIKQWLWGFEIGNSDKDVGMLLKYNEFSEETELHIFYRPITKEEEADKARRAKEAGKDF
jgi:hypothetical protein